MPDMTTIIRGLIARSSQRLSVYPEASLLEPRLDRGGEQFVENLWNSMHALAVEGSYFVAQTPTPGTGVTISSATGTSFSDTGAIVAVNNRDSAPSLGGQGRDIILDYLKLIITAAGTAGTDSHVASRLDIGARGSN